MLTVEVCTKDRYESLGHTLQSVCHQSFTPSEIIIFDDSEKKFDLRNSSIYTNLFKLMARKNINWKVEFSPSHGQLKNHIKATELCKTEFLYRCDDDHVLESNVLGSLMDLISKDKNTGAVCNTILHPDLEFEESCTSEKIQDCLFKYAVNFSRFQGIKETQHIYSSFLSRIEAIKGSYPSNLSKVGHREETVCSHNIYKKGYKLLCRGDTFTWHLKENHGGIRSYNDAKLWDSDESLFQKYLQQNKITCTEYFLMINNGAIGDNYAFRHILPLIRQKHPTKKLILGTVYPNIYFDEKNVDEIVSIHSANILSRGGHEKFDLYKLGWENGLNESVIDIYKKIYGV